MSQNTNDAYRGYIKDIWLELPDYEFKHGSVDESKEDSHWVGRKEIEDKLHQYLADGDSGAYLVTGYRGMGKTSFVKRIINKYINKEAKEQKKTVKEITISFGQKDIKEVDVLRQMVKGMMDKILPSYVINFFYQKVFSIRTLPIWTIVIFFILLFSGSIIGSDESSNELFEYKISNNLTLTFKYTIISDEGWKVSLTLLVISLMIGYTILVWLRLLFRNSFISIKSYDRLEDLYDRCRSQITKEDGGTTGEKLPFNLTDKSVKNFPMANPKEMENELIKVLEDYNKSINNKKQKYMKNMSMIIFLITCISLPTAILALYIDRFFFILPILYIIIFNFALSIIIFFVFENIFRKYAFPRKFIFIFDEIDKVDPLSSNVNSNEDLDKFEKVYESNLHSVRERKKMVIDILANLKYLITTAKAKFVFIAGREMFDAALADITDRQSAISSVFHEVIYVDSFLKDKSHENTLPNYGKTIGLTSLVENYLEKIMFENGRKDKIENSFIKNYYNFIISNLTANELVEKRQAARTIIYNLQNLIVYLAYRSNGSPKKMIRLIDELIKVKTVTKLDTNQCAFSEKTVDLLETNKEIWVYYNNDGIIDNRKKTKYYLHINYHTLYKIGFINYIYRSFLSSNGNEYKLYSDKILVSTPYLLDHIIKFHPFAFSLRNLELAPEVISETRSPELRYFIEELIIHLGKNHIRDTDTPLFEYKFSHRTFHEINYLCKIFESESAAFNFTLDENYNIKLHIKNKIKELRNIHKEYLKGNENFNYIKSISFLNDLLANARYYDEEYDEAIIAYLDAIQPIEQYLSNDFDYELLVNYLTLNLKLGLTYEKMKDYRKALATYAETHSKVHFFLNKVVDKTKIWKMDLMELVCQPILAGLYLQEKVDTVSTIVIDKSIKELKAYILATSKCLDKKQKNVVLASIYSSVGTLLYYKNSVENFGENSYENREFKFLTDYNEANTGISLREFRTSSNTYKYFRRNLENLLANDFDCQLRDADDETSHKTLIELLQYAENYISSFIGSREPNPNATINPLAKHDKKHAKNIAASINRLADCLYSNLLPKKPDRPKKNEKINIAKEIFLPKEIEKWSLYNFGILITNQGGIPKKFEYEENLAVFVSSYDRRKVIFDISRNGNKDSYIFQLVICMYFLSGELYMRIGRNMECSFIFQKIIQSFKLLVQKETIVAYIPVLEKYFLNRILHITSWNGNAADKYQVKKYEYAFSDDSALNASCLNKYNILNTSGSSEIREALVLFSELKLKTNISQNEVDGIQSLITQYNIVPTQTARYHELRLQIELNKQKILSSFEGKDIFKTIEISRESAEKKCNTFSTKDEFYCKYISLQDTIVNSIHCLYQIINIYKGFGLNYCMSYSSLGKYYEYLGNWLQLYDIYNSYHANYKKKLQERLILAIIKDIKHISSKNECLYYLRNIFNSNTVQMLLHGIKSTHLVKRIDDELNFIFKKANLEKQAILKEFLGTNTVTFEELCTSYIRDIQCKLEDILGPDIVRTLDYISQYQRALEHYSRAKQLHNEGAPYKALSVNMYYLEDDYTDSLYLFGIAVERQKINSGKIRQYINSLKSIVDNYKDKNENSPGFYDYKYYVPE